MTRVKCDSLKEKKNPTQEKTEDKTIYNQMEQKTISTTIDKIRTK